MHMTAPATPVAHHLQLCENTREDLLLDNMHATAATLSAQVDIPFHLGAKLWQL